MKHRASYRLRYRLVAGVLAASLGFGGAPVPGFAQPSDTLITGARLLRSLRAPRALAVDPAGRLYVVDAGPDVVLRIDPETGAEERLGGTGSGEGEFEDPADIDPTNGLALYVADAGNGRIQRFSREFRFLESIPVGRTVSSHGGRTPTYRVGDGGVVGSGDGRPIAVLTSSSNDLFVIDDLQRVVVKWTRDRTLERTIGGYDQGEGALVEPVALAMHGSNTLFVADRGCACVRAYDLFGNYIRTVAEGRAEGVRALHVVADRLWIVLPDRIHLYYTHGLPDRTLRFALDTPLVDAAQANGTLYLLTERSLHAVPVP